jgi:hypothetical protein
MKVMDLDNGTTEEVVKDQEVVEESSVTEEPEAIPPEEERVEAEEETEPEPELEAWQTIEEEEKEIPESVPLSVFVKKKKQLKSKLADSESKIKELEQKVESLSLGATPQQQLDVGKVPAEYDFDTPEEYHAAMNQYVAKLAASQLDKVEQQRNQQAQQAEQNRRLEQARDNHFKRAEKLIETSGIKADSFLEAEDAFKTSLDEVSNGQGEVLADHLIDVMGEGSEKVVYYLGRNKPKMLELQALMATDPTGLKVSNYLGKLQTQLSKPAKKVSRAPAPSKTLKGDANANSSGSALQRKYKEAHKKGQTSQAWKLKREAKAAGIDTKGW